MDDSVKTFEIELNRLLEQHLGDGELNNLNRNLDLPEEGSDKIPRIINDFYKSQLQIKNINYGERFKIDRSITLAEKALLPDNFYAFLLDLGKLCLSGNRLNLASEIFRKVNTHSRKTLHKAEALLGLAEVFRRRADWQKNLRTVKDTESFYRELNDNGG
jgi:hypothetical protein